MYHRALIYIWMNHPSPCLLPVFVLFFNVTLLVSWCFEPSQPQRITSGLSNLTKVGPLEDDAGYKPVQRNKPAAAIEMLAGTLTQAVVTTPTLLANCDPVSRNRPV